MINLFEVAETNKMIEQENLDVRTITIGISLLDCMDHDIDVLCKNIYNKITTVAKDLVKTGEEIEKKYSDEIEMYKFIQFIISKQNEETRKFAKENDIKMIADRQVAFSDRDTWAYQSLFLKGWCLGCPPDYFSKDGQAWGFPVMDPERLYNSDGSLDEGGQLLKNLYKKMFRENPGGVRIDHIVGLIDPWVYKAGKKPMIEQGAGRLYSSPDHPELSKYAIAKIEDLDMELTADKEKRVKTLSKQQIKDYGRLIEKIVIEAAKEEGLDKDAIVCEDLGTLTNPVAAVMETYGLQGMKLTQFVEADKPEDPYRCCNINKRTWAMVGTHDNEPIKMWANQNIHTHTGYLHAKNLVDDLFAEADNKDDIIVKLTDDAEFLAQTKLVELFASCAENIQIFFTDYFNIYDVSLAKKNVEVNESPVKRWISGNFEKTQPKVRIYRLYNVIRKKGINIWNKFRN